MKLHVSKAKFQNSKALKCQDSKCTSATEEPIQRLAHCSNCTRDRKEMNFST